MANPLPAGLSRHFTVFTLFLIICPLTAPLAPAQPPASSSKEDKKSKPALKTDLSELKVSELIDMLREESKEDSTAWASGFLATEEQPQFPRVFPGWPKTSASPVMKELVRRGVTALPELIDHLQDPRETKLIISHKSYVGGMLLGDEYDSRFSDSKRKPPGVNTGLEKSEWIDKRKYNICVGDLCYIAIGQIVNRSLNAVRYQPTNCIIINSPVKTPSLATAVKNDWTGLTVEQHKKSLSEDALNKNSFISSAAMVRLLFYYPKEGDSLALKLLARPLYGESALWDFITKRLVKESDPSKWKTMIEEFRTANGQAAADSIPFRLHWIYGRTDSEGDKKLLEEKGRVLKILAQLYPTYDPYKPSFINAASSQERADIIQLLVKYRGQDKEFHNALASRIKALEGLPKDSDERRSLEGLYSLRNLYR
jgi:hypothetical protein